jgi:hypothetical protein
MEYYYCEKHEEILDKPCQLCSVDAFVESYEYFKRNKLEQDTEEQTG